MGMGGMNEGFFIVFRWDLEQCLEHGIAELLCIGFSPVFLLNGIEFCPHSDFCCIFFELCLV